MIELYLGMGVITAAFVWTRMPPHKDLFELIMLVSLATLWPMLLIYAGYLIWEQHNDA